MFHARIFEYPCLSGVVHEQVLKRLYLRVHVPVHAHKFRGIFHTEFQEILLRK